jgi:hypothetical protein
LCDLAVSDDVLLPVLDDLTCVSDTDLELGRGRIEVREVDTCCALVEIFGGEDTSLADLGTSESLSPVRWAGLGMEPRGAPSSLTLGRYPSDGLAGRP